MNAQSLYLFYKQPLLSINRDGTWVLGRNLEVSSNGDIVEEGQKKYTWVDDIILKNLPNSIRLEEVSPVININFDDTSIISEYDVIDLL